MKKKYAVVGTGGRAGFYYLTSIARDYQQISTFVSFCDTNQTRMQYADKMIGEWGHAPVPCFSANQFETIIAECKPANPTL